MSLQYIDEDGVKRYIAGGGGSGSGGDPGVVMPYEEYKRLSDKSGLYYVSGQTLPDGDLSGAIVKFDSEGDIPVLPTLDEDTPEKLTSGESLSSLFKKVAELARNLRWFFGHLGDIRKVAGGDITEGGVTTHYDPLGGTGLLTDAIYELSKGVDIEVSVLTLLPFTSNTYYKRYQDNTNYGIRYQKYGRIVAIYMDAVQCVSVAGTQTAIGTLPEGFRPGKTVQAKMISSLGTADDVFLQITPAGVVSLMQGTVNALYYGSLLFLN